MAQLADGAPKPNFELVPGDGWEKPLCKTPTQGPAQDAQRECRPLKRGHQQQMV